MNGQAQFQKKSISPPSSKTAESGILQRKCACGTHTVAGDKCGECQAKEGVLQRKSSNNSEMTEVPPIVGEVLSASGEPLDKSTQKFFEPRFDHDFSGVRIHNDAKAAESALAVNALAYTVGKNVVFGAGLYAPETTAGKQLLAHELTHVVQQSAVTSVPANLKLGNPSDSFEQEADAGKDLISRPHIEGNVKTPVVQRTSQPVIMRAQLFSSTIEICHSLLKSRVFNVSAGGLKVDIDARWHGPDGGTASCEDHRKSPYHVTLTQKDYVIDNDYGSCGYSPLAPDNNVWTGVPPGDYYLTIWTNNTNPNCCLEGEIEVSEDAGITGDSCTELPDDVLTILHDVLDAAGLIPVLGAIPDGVNAGIYVIQGDWTNAGISAAAMIPIFGEGVTITKVGVKVTRRAVKRLGKEGIELGLKKAKASAKKAVVEGVEKSVEKELVEQGSKRAGKEIVESALQRAARYAREGTILTYKEGKEITEGLAGAYQAHHILEARHIRNWFKKSGEAAVNQAVLQAPSVILERETHQALSRLLAAELPTGMIHSKQAVKAAYQRVYAKFPEYLKAIEHYFR